MIHRIEQYTDGKHTIIASTPVDGSGGTTFHAEIVHRINVGNGQVAQSNPVRIDLLCATVEEAFAILPMRIAESRAAAVAELEAQRRKALLLKAVPTNGGPLRIAR